MMGFKGKQKILCIAVALVVIVFSGQAVATPPASNAADCRGLLEQFHPQGAAAGQDVDALSRMRDEHYSLAQFFTPGADRTSVASNHPMIAMNAAQRYLYMIKSQGERVELDPENGTTPVRIYAALSDGVPAARGRKTVGHPRVGEILVGNLELQADGFKSGLKIPLMVGVPGSGKTEGAEVLKNISNTLTLNDERFFLYTFEFTALESIPRLTRFFMPDETGKVRNIPDPLSDSPLLLLPPVYHRAAMNQLSQEVMRLTGRTPRPKSSLSPPSRFIRNEILAHYRDILREQTGQPDLQLTQEQEMEFLNRHVVVKRLVMDGSKAPIIDYQDRNVELGAFFMQPDISMKGLVPTTHPLAFEYGQVIGANGGIVVFDEVLKYPEGFQHALLGTIQARRYSLNGAEPVEFDIVFLGATNTDDVIRLEEKAKTHVPPFLDRSVRIPMNWSIRPHEIMQILTYQIPKLQMVDLSTAGAAAEPVRTRGNLERMVVKPETPFLPWLGPDRRFALFKGEDAGVDVTHALPRVDIAPHALLYLARVVALSRTHVYNEKKLQELLGDTYKSAPAPYRDAVARLAMVEGRLETTPAALTAFWDFSTKGLEGIFGISSRDADGWLAEAFIESTLPGNGNTVTPLLLRNVLMRKLRDRTIGGNDAQRALFNDIATEVGARLTVDAIKADLVEAIGGINQAEIDATYSQVYTDLLALKRAGPGATPLSGTLIDRITRIRAVYKAQNGGRDLDLGEILIFSTENARFTPPTGSTETIKYNEQLYKAVSDYVVQARLASVDTRLDTVLRFLRPTLASGVQSAALTELDQDLVKAFLRYMREKFGYSEAAVAQAIQLVRSIPSTRP